MRNRAPGRPHEAHSVLDKVDGNDEEVTKRSELDDRFGLEPVERCAADDELAFARLEIALTLDDFADEEDVFEIEDREVVIIKFFGGVNGNDVVQ